MQSVEYLKTVQQEYDQKRKVFSLVHFIAHYRHRS